ncbi:MAG: N-6 DNA methylase [Phycisphaerales bacterium]|nr:N-6 DNA methylase [Phycisphaerales bacterium]
MQSRRSVQRPFSRNWSSILSVTANSLSASSDLEALRRQLRAYEQTLDRSKRKRLGQFFSGTRASSLLAALSIRGQERTIVDPMAGHGDLLDAAALRCNSMGLSVQLSAVEIDPPTAELARRRLRLCAEVGGHAAETIETNAFKPGLWTGERSPGSFDLVITNPPYVRYQEHSSTRGARESRFEAGDIRAALRELVRMLPDRNEAQAWSALIEGYSGLADLSVPCWMLCSLLVRPGGILALVVPQTWMNREYAKIIQYVQLRFFEPLVVVEEHGVGWFEDALVPTTLVVSRRLSTHESIVPLSSRPETTCTTTIAAIRAAAADSRSLVGRDFAGPDPDAAFAQWLLAPSPESTDHITVRRVPWAEQWQAVSARCRHDHWFRAAGEYALQPGLANSSLAPLPAPLQTALGRETAPALTTFEALGFQIGQGLRTGCNQFFYMEAAGPDSAGGQHVRASDTLGGRTLCVPDELLKPVVRRQSDVPGFAVQAGAVLGRVLDLRGWCLPEHCGAAAALRPIPAALADLVRRASQTTIGPPERRVLIPELSAVKTNSRAGSGNERLFPGVGTPRHWYTLPDFAPRHHPSLFVARVNSGTPWFILNAQPPMLIDANFSTIYGSSRVMSSIALLALLNSTWCRACTEFIGTPMGGGALKLEATQLRHLPLPVLPPEAMSPLQMLGEQLATSTTSRSEELTLAIDRIVLGALIPASETVEASLSRLRSLIADRCAQRSRAPREAVLFDHAD